jgi:Transglutaminase-like superfamily
MRKLLTICLLFYTLVAFGQSDIETLAQQLTSSCKTEREKVTKIFRWITDNISYRIRSNRIPVIGAASLRFSQSEEEPDTSALKPLNERVAETVLKTRLAVCDGYSRLFSTLCDYAGIRSEIIVGYAKGNSNKPSPKFGVNHYWNAVFLDGRWQLLDATWASGYVSRQEDEFVRDYDDNYFLTDPAVFIRDHYPDDPRWTLLADATVPDEFRHSPFKQKSFLKYKITSFFPSKGVIEAVVGDIIQLELETADPERDKKISPDLLIDSSIFTQSASWIFLEPQKTDMISLAPGKYRYIYKVETSDVEWLYLKYNDDLVLRYKINVKKKKT